MRRFNKFFSKKDKPEDHGSVPENTDLASLSPTELMSLVGKLDDELRKQTAAVLALTEDRDKAVQEANTHSEEVRLYREVARVRGMQTAQEQYQKADIEMNDMRQVLDSKKAEVEMLRTQQISLEETITKFRRDLQVSESRVASLESQLAKVEAGHKATEAEEVAHLRSELQRISTLVREGQKSEQRVQELEIIKKNLESELLKFSFQVEASSTQLKQAREKLAETAQRLQDAETQLQKKQLNLDSFKQEAVSFAFQKESMENEVRAMKDILTRGEAAVFKKKEKLKTVKAQWAKARADLEMYRATMEARVKELQSDLQHCEADAAQRLAYTEEVARLKQDSLERDMADKQRELEEANASRQAAFAKCEERETKCAALEEQVLELLQTKKSLTARLDAAEQDTFKLKAQLESAQHKREQARAELIKLSQKLEQKSSPGKVAQTEGLDAFYQAPDGLETRVLPRLKRDVDLIYKALMRAMLTAKDVSFPSEDLTKDIPGLLMELELFSDVERKVNDLVMNLHEVMDSADVGVECFTEESPQSWSGRLTSAITNIRDTVKTVDPGKLFSCMPHDRRSPPPLTIKPKTEQGRKLTSATGGDSRVDQQQQAWTKQPQSGYKRF